MKIEKDIPIPEDLTPTYPFAKMEVGDSVTQAGEAGKQPHRPREFMRLATPIGTARPVSLTTAPPASGERRRPRAG